MICALGHVLLPKCVLVKKSRALGLLCWSWILYTAWHYSFTSIHPCTLHYDTLQIADLLGMRIILLFGAVLGVYLDHLCVSVSV